MATGSNGSGGNGKFDIHIQEGDLGLTVESVADEYTPRITEIYKRHFPNRAFKPIDVVREFSKIVECAGDLAVHDKGLAVFSEQEANFTREMLSVIDEMANRSVLKRAGEVMKVTEYKDAAGHTRFSISNMDDNIIRSMMVTVFAFVNKLEEKDLHSLVPVTLQKSGIAPRSGIPDHQFVDDYLFLQDIANLDHFLAKIKTSGNGVATIGEQEAREFGQINGLERLEYIVSANFPSIYNTIKSQSAEGTLVFDAASISRLKEFTGEARKLASYPEQGARLVGQMAGDECLRQQCEIAAPDLKKFYDFRRSTITSRAFGSVTCTVDIFKPQYKSEILESILTILPDFESKLIDNGNSISMPQKALDRLLEFHRKLDGFVEKGQWDEARAYVSEMEATGRARAAAKASKEAVVQQPAPAGIAQQIVAKSDLETFLEPISDLQHAFTFADRLTNRDARLGDKRMATTGEIVLEFKTDEEAEAVAAVFKKLVGSGNGIHVPKEDNHKHKLKHPIVVKESAFEKISENVSMLKEGIAGAKEAFTQGDKDKAQQELDAVLDIAKDLGLNADILANLPARTGHKIG